MLQNNTSYVKIWFLVLNNDRLVRENPCQRRKAPVFGFLEKQSFGLKNDFQYHVSTMFMNKHLFFPIFDSEILYTAKRSNSNNAKKRWYNLEIWIMINENVICFLSRKCFTSMIQIFHNEKHMFYLLPDPSRKSENPIKNRKLFSFSFCYLSLRDKVGVSNISIWRSHNCSNMYLNLPSHCDVTISTNLNWHHLFSKIH